MNRYLEKIAKEEKKEHKARHDVAGGIGAGYGAGIVGREVQPTFQKPVINQVKKGPHSLNKGVLKNILKDNRDLDVTFSKHKAYEKSTYGNMLRDYHNTGAPGYMNKNIINTQLRAAPRFSWDKGNVDPMRKSHISMERSELGIKTRSKDISIAAHELGHARDYERLSKSKLGRRIQRFERKASGNPVLGSTVGGAMLGSKKTRDYAWTAPIASIAPVLRSEGAANYHGYKMIAKHGTPGMRGKFLATAGRNMLGYAGGALTSSALLHGVAKYLDHRDNKEEKRQ